MSGTSAPRASSRMGAIFGGGVALRVPGSAQSPWLLPRCCSPGRWAACCGQPSPRASRTRFNANEILTSADARLRGYARPVAARARCVARPGRIQLPAVEGVRRCALLPNLLPETRLNVGFLLASPPSRARLALHAQEPRRVSRCASRAWRPPPPTTPGISATRTVWLGMLIGGALRGPRRRGRSGGTDRPAAADPCRRATASPRSSSRSSADCIRSVLFFASLLMSLLVPRRRVGADRAWRFRPSVTGLFQGTLLFFLLAADVFINYRLRVAHGARARCDDRDGP